MKSALRTIGAVSIFSIAMAALESAVVVYLRALYYPEEFNVQFKIIDEHILLIEIVREVATLLMLSAVSYIAGNNFRERLAYFLLSFAVWDIFYYGWLKVFYRLAVFIFGLGYFVPDSDYLDWSCSGTPYMFGDNDCAGHVSSLIRLTH